MKIQSLSSYFGLKDNNRAVFIGRTGGGKTALAKKFAIEFNSVLVLDFKHTIRLENSEITSDVRRLERLGIDFRQIVFRIPYEWEEEHLNNLIKWAFIRENTIIYIDEGYSLGTSNSYPKWLRTATVAGREKGVGVWSLFQRPKGAPVFLFTESEHFFIFFVQRPEDQQYIEEVAGTKINWDVINPAKNTEHLFYHVKAGNGATGPYKLGGIV